MAQIKGVVEKVWENTKPGAPTTYSVVVDNIKYSTYTTKPKCKAGDSVTFAATQNGNFWNMNTRTLEVVEGGAKPSPAPANDGVGPPRTWGKDSATQDAINYQSARKDALVWVDFLMRSQLLDLGKTKGKQIEAAEVFLDMYTKRFYQDTKDLGHKPPSTTEGVTPADGFEDDDIPF